MLSIVKETELPCRLLSKKTLTMLPALAKRGLIILQQRKSYEVYNKSIAPLPILSDPQQQCLTSINQYFQSEKSTVLLQGVTGSGKTELYIHLIAEAIGQQGDVLLLVPEIAITSQLVKRLECIFGNRVTVYHSKLSVRHRSEVYMQMLHSEGGELVVGTRSALFLPFRHLRLIVVDEEHDRSYKQADVQPRYNARDVAVMMAKVWHCHTLLGSATPSLESYVNAVTNKYGLVQLSERYGGVKHPHIMVSDTIQAAKRNERKKHFNLLLLQKIKEKLALGEQVMLFQNRRGYSPYVECKACGWTARCPHCNVTLVYHHCEQLRCHYCGYTIPFVRECPQCRKMEVTSVGFGTEKVEDELLRLIPDVRVERLDGDTATSNKAYRAIIERFASGESDVLIGTQMITKGFDFPNVSLVGILNADNLLLNPDFRAAERAFQLMIQMAGRTGRRDKRGEVIIQTSEPEHPIILQIEKEDYEAMARTQLSERYTYGYPPYARLILLTLYHRDESLLWQASMELSSLLKNHFGRRVQGPMSPAVDRIRGLYIVTVMLKIESGASMTKARQILRSELQLFFVRREYKTITYDCDVDPQ
jgi:primosomal protein N' (replication factor Y)